MLKIILEVGHWPKDNKRYCNWLGPINYKESGTCSIGKMLQNQLYFDKFSCSLFNKEKKHVTLSKTLMSFKFKGCQNLKQKKPYIAPYIITLINLFWVVNQ